MTHKSLAGTVELYREEEKSVAEIAAKLGVDKADVVTELRSQGIELREEDDGAVTSTRA